MVDGAQYVSIAVGWGGVYGLAARAADRVGPGRVYTFALDGKAPLPQDAQYAMTTLVSGVALRQGGHRRRREAVRQQLCLLPRRPRRRSRRQYPEPGLRARVGAQRSRGYLYKQPLAAQGMPDFTGKLTPGEVAQIRAFIQGTVDSIRGK